MDKNSIQIISDFSEKVRGKDGIKYADYAEIRRIQDKDIPKAIKDIQDQLEYVKNSKNPDGTPKTTEQISAESAEWNKYLASIVALESAWKNTPDLVKTHKEENYEKVVSETRAKLAELFGEVNGKSPAPAPVTQVTQPAKVDSAAATHTIPRTPEAITKDIEGFKEKSYSIDGKKVDFIKIDKINDRYEITLKIDNSTQQTFYLDKNKDGTWKTVEPTSNDYNIIFKNNEVTITTKKSEAVSA
jgi:hypothetical protein